MTKCDRGGGQNCPKIAWSTLSTAPWISLLVIPKFFHPSVLPFFHPFILLFFFLYNHHSLHFFFKSTLLSIPLSCLLSVLPSFSSLHHSFPSFFLQFLPSFLSVFQPFILSSSLPSILSSFHPSFICSLLTFVLPILTLFLCFLTIWKICKPRSFFIPSLYPAFCPVERPLFKIQISYTIIRKIRS